MVSLREIDAYLAQNFKGLLAFDVFGDGAHTQFTTAPVQGSQRPADQWILIAGTHQADADLDEIRVKPDEQIKGKRTSIKSGKCESATKGLELRDKGINLVRKTGSLRHRYLE